MHLRTTTFSMVILIPSLVLIPSFTRCHVISNLYDFLSCVEHKRYLTNVVVQTVMDLMLGVIQV